MRERRDQNIQSAVKVFGFGLCAMAVCGAASACDYHWAIGVPEPTGIWPSLTDKKAIDLAAATSAALVDIDHQDTINDAAITKWMQNTTIKGHSPNATINNL